MEYITSTLLVVATRGAMLHVIMLVCFLVIIPSNQD